MFYSELPECKCCSEHSKAGDCVGVAFCTACVPGQYQPKPGQATCNECPVGTNAAYVNTVFDCFFYKINL